MGDTVARSPASRQSAASPKSASPPGDAASPGSAPGADGAEQQNLEVDPDADEGLDEQLSAYTASLSSSVVDYPVENGRRYHAYRKGAYLLPNDDRESDRLDMMHHIIVRTLEGRIYLAPIDEDKVQNILDIGTGTGSLAIELADALPGAQVIGSDLSPTQTTWTPPNLKFEVDDVELDWAYPFKFDFIVCGYMTGSINDWPRLVQQVHDNLAPGGWAEFQEFDLQYACDDGTFTEEHHFHRWNKGLLDGVSAVGRDGYPGHKVRSLAEGAGFSNIHEQRFKIPVGTWPKDPTLKQTGLMNVAQLLDGMEAFSLKTFGVLGWGREELEVFLADVRREMKAGKSHIYNNFYVVYGQKD